MTDQEFDELLCRVMIDAAKADIEEIEAENIPVSSSRHFQREMRKMLKDPLRWAKAKTRPMWKTVLQKVAVFFIVCSLSLGSIIAFSPTVRAAVIRWVTEWYETYVVYRYSGEETMKEMPRFGIAALPEGYKENVDKRIQMPEYGRVLYENDEGEWIWLRYVYMQQGAASVVELEGSEVKHVEVDGHEGYFFLSDNFEENDNSVTWIDDEKGIQFTVDGHFEEQAILNIAESVILEDITKE